MSFLSIHSNPITYDAPDNLPSVRKVKSSMCLDEALDEIKGRIQSLWPHTTPEKVIVKVDDQFIKNPFLELQQGKKKKATDNTMVERVAVGSKTRVNILEGCGIEILLPEIKIDVQGTEILLEIMESFNVKAVKYRLLSNASFPKDVKPKLDKRDKGVFYLDHQQLDDGILIRDLDFTSHVFNVDYPSLHLHQQMLT